MGHTGTAIFEAVLRIYTNYFNESSGVTRVPCALGQEMFLRPPSAKLTEFELKK